jgi:adenylate cyclase
MAPHQFQRRLAAILAADVVGYSRLTGADEEGTIARLRALRQELIDPVIAVNNGRLVKTTGDGRLVEFTSVVDALRCAVEVQSKMALRNTDVAPDKRIEFRVGINLGDIIVEGDGDLMGDCVNIAARLESIAEPGGICLSEDAYRQARGKVTMEFIDLGEKELKNIAQPVRVYRVVFDWSAANAARNALGGSGAGLSLPDKPSIAVMPFENMSGDPEQDYFADGMVEDITTGLSRIKWVFVIARNSSFMYKGKPVDVRQVGRELGVRYVLEGSVRKAGGRVRITGQLIEAETGAHLWADKFDGPLDDIFDLQDRITASVVGVVEPSIRHAEIERARRKRPDNLDAYDLYLRALPYSLSLIPADSRAAIRFLEEALLRDPKYAPAHALAAWCHCTCFLHAGFDEADKVAAIRSARAAITGGTDDAATLATAAIVILIIGHDRQTALSAVERALFINDACATALYFGAQIHAWNGNSALATDLANRALRLSPYDHWSYVAHQATGLAYIAQERYADAASSFAKGIQANPRFVSLYAFHAVALSFGERSSEARLVVQPLLELEPAFRSRIFREVGFVPALAAKLYSGLRQLGVED